LALREERDVTVEQINAPPKGRRPNGACFSLGVKTNVIFQFQALEKETLLLNKLMRPEGPGTSVHAISLGQNKEAILLLFKRFRKEESPK
jgi:hypothetical protein